MSNIVKFEDREKNMKHFRELVAIAVKTGSYQMTPEVMMNIMLTAADFGISPMKALNGGFYVVKGKISMSTALMTDRIRSDGHSVQIPEWTSKKCVVMGKRKDNGDQVIVEFTMEDAQLAGLAHSEMWKKYPKNMLYNRAMSILARTLFPDVVGQAYSEDEGEEIAGIPVEQRKVYDPVVDCVDVTPSLETRAVDPVAPHASGDPLDNLRGYISDEGHSAARLDEYISHLAEKKKVPVDEVVKSASMPEMFTMFKKAYCTWFDRTSAEGRAV